MRTAFISSLFFFLLPASVFSSSLCTDTTVRIMTWNLLNFPSQSALADDTTIRLPCYRKVAEYINPDIVVTQENTGGNSIAIFLSSVLNANGSQYSAGTFIDGYDTDNGIFFRTSCFRFISNIPIATALRDVSLFTLVHISTGDTIRILSCHLKSSSGSANEALRAAEADSIRKVTNTFLPGSDFMVCGDFNFYGSSEPGYQGLLLDDNVTDGDFVDPIVLAGNWNNPTYSQYHTQSPRTRSFGGGVAGGLDDRFDLMLFSSAVIQPGRITYQAGTLTAVGNDGLHYGDSINRPPNAAVSQQVADALHCASDHLPVLADFIFSPVIAVENVSRPAVQLKFFPNPSEREITVTCLLHHGGTAAIIVYDPLGKTVKKISEKSTVPGVYEKVIVTNGELQPGNYFVRMTVGVETLSGWFTLE